ncbi:MAG TPA: DUF892 family protein [Gaiellaceae bacterium]|nr:DUF892 family protein [Gaiellaceae bacterium]
MTEPLDSPRDLLALRLRQLLWIERALARDVLPRLHAQAHQPELREKLGRHLLETERHVEALQRLVASVGLRPEPEESLAFAGLVAEHERLVEAAGDDPLLLDLAHAQSAAATEHLEMASYDALAALAEALGEEALGIGLRELQEQESFALEQVEKAQTKLLAEQVESLRYARP